MNCFPPQKIKVSFLIFTGLLFSSCQSNEKAPPPAKPVPVVTVKALEIPDVAEFPGQVYGIQDIPIRARVEGFLEKMSFNEGSLVQKGDLLYTVDPLPYQARLNASKSRLAQAEVAGVKAKTDLDRIKPLAERSAVSQSDLTAAQASYDASQAAIEAAKAEVELAEIELSYARISAPITGIIGKTEAREGEYVGRSPNPVILNTVSKTDSFRVEFFIPERSYLAIARLEQTADTNSPKRSKPTFELILSDGEALGVNGYFDFLDRAVERSTGAIRAQVIFPNESGIIRPGQFVRLRILQERNESVIAVPLRAVGDLQGMKYVYTLDENNVPKRTQIELGTVWNDLVVVNSGLEEGMKILLEGIQSAQSGAPIAPKDTSFASVNGMSL